MIAGAAAALAARAAAALQAIREWRDARAAARHLDTLSDEQLKDIGIHRGQIAFLVRGLSVPWTRGGHAEH